MPIRTARLAEGQTGAAGVTVVAYTCPAGRTAIIKDVRLSTIGGAAVNTIVALTSGPRFCNILVEALPGAGVPRSMQPYLVLEPGDQVVINASQPNGIIYWLSGVELDGVAP